MESLQGLVLFDLIIPVWQIVLYIGLISFFMLIRSVRLLLVTPYLFVSYWIYYLFRADIVSAASGDRLALALYTLFGFAIAGLSLFAFFFSEEKISTHLPLGPEMANLRRALLRRIERMESSIKESEAKAMSKVQQSGEFRLDMETKAAALKAQLQEKEESLHAGESAIKQVEEGLNARILDLETQLEEKDRLLKTRSVELRDTSSQMETKAAFLEENLKAKINDLETQLREKEGLLEKEQRENHQQSISAELERLRAELRDRSSLLQARETEVRMTKQSMEEKVKELERAVQREAGREPKKSRLVSFLASIEKRK